MRASSLVCGLMVLAACQATSPPLSDADKAAIRAVSDSFVAFVRSNRDSAAASLFTEHAVWMPANRGIVEGRAAILAAFQARPGLDFTVFDIDIDGRGDLAYVRGTYAFAILSADRKSATVVIRVRTATRAASPICSVARSFEIGRAHV